MRDCVYTTHQRNKHFEVVLSLMDFCAKRPPHFYTPKTTVNHPQKNCIAAVNLEKQNIPFWNGG